MLPVSRERVALSDLLSHRFLFALASGFPPGSVPLCHPLGGAVLVLLATGSVSLCPSFSNTPTFFFFSFRLICPTFCYLSFYRIISSGQGLVFVCLFFISRVWKPRTKSLQINLVIPSYHHSANWSEYKIRPQELGSNVAFVADSPNGHRKLCLRSLLQSMSVLAMLRTQVRSIGASSC